VRLARGRRAGERAGPRAEIGAVVADVDARVVADADVVTLEARRRDARAALAAAVDAERFVVRGVGVERVARLTVGRAVLALRAGVGRLHAIDPRVRVGLGLRAAEEAAARAALRHAVGEDAFPDVAAI